ETLAVSCERWVTSREPLAAALRLPASLLSEAEVFERVERILALLRLTVFRDRFASELSTGSRRLVEFGCLLAHEPEVLLLDERSAGPARAAAHRRRRVLARSGTRPPAEPDRHHVGGRLLAAVNVVEVGVPVAVARRRQRQRAVRGAGGVQRQLGGGERHQRTVGVAPRRSLTEPVGAGIVGAGGQEGDGAAGALGHQGAVEMCVDGRGG